ncbi:MAG: hypothetical protein H7282_04900 [Cytophagaceae bacterium]|nr:hypothetical protein [Cytophagaceae bacterium]
MSEKADWTVADKDGTINIPDELAPLFNKLGFQMRFVLLSDKNEIQAVVDMCWLAQKFFSEHPEALLKPEAAELPDLHDAIHQWFELSYSQYLTIPRSVLQSMPSEWQKQFVKCLNELDEKIDWRPSKGRYWVQLKNEKGQYVHDPLMDYQRGRRVIPFTTEVKEGV